MTPTAQLAGVTAVLAVAAAPLVARRQPVLDDWICAAIVRERPPGCAGAARAVTALAEPAAVLTALGVSAGVAGRTTGLPIGPLVRAAAMTAAGIASRRVLAERVRRPRPPSRYWWSDADGFSFPSRHTTWAVLGYGLAADLVARAGHRRAAVLVRTGPPAAVGLSRLLLSVHWSSDVVAAVVFGVGWRAAAGGDGELRAVLGRAPHHR